MTSRREFITLLGGSTAAFALVWPHSACAQVVRRVGILMNAAATDSNPQSYLAAFVQGLRQLGWTEGQNIRIDVRWNAGDAQLARIYAAQLIGLNPDVIVTASTTNLTIVRQATSSIPIVFTQVSDPVAQGFVASIAKPGGNLTGFSMFEFSVGGKWLDLLKEIAPRLAHVGVMFNPDTSPQSAFFMRSIEAAAPALGVQALAVPVRATNEIEPAIENLARRGNGGLILPTDTFTYLRLNLIADLASQHRMPTIAAADIFPRSGGLMYYGASVSLADHFRQAAGYVDRILKGARPAEMPVQRADKYTFVVNIKTAKTLGLDVPAIVLVRADEVIE